MISSDQKARPSGGSEPAGVSETIEMSSNEMKCNELLMQATRNKDAIWQTFLELQRLYNE